MGIKSLELDPTKENILSTIEKDLLDRNESVLQFVKFCNAQEGKCSIALNAQWGYGKTFFVKQAKMLFEALNGFSTSLNEEERSAVKKAFFTYIGTEENPLNIQPHFCVYYDAWSNDNDVDPVLSLVYEIVRTTKCDYLLPNIHDIAKIAVAIIELFTGKNIEGIIEALSGEDLLSTIEAQKSIQDTVKAFFDSLMEEKGNRLIIFVDELDRCKPDFAVRFLERIKHYFSDERITFVFSVNLGELQHTIKRFYGEGFDAGRYLDRFFDYRVQLPPAVMDRYYQEVGLYDMHAFDKICRAVAKHYTFSLRELVKFTYSTKIAADSLIHNSYSGSSERNAMVVATYLFVPVIMGVMMVDSNLYNDFIRGRNSAPLVDIIKDESIAMSVCSLLLDQNEVFSGERYNDGKTVVFLKDKLSQAYDALLTEDDKRPWGEAKVGNCIFENRTRETLIQIVSMLSRYASY